MFTGGNNISLADIAAVTDNNRNNDGWGDGWLIWIVLIFAMFGWGGNGWGNGNNGLQGALTRGDLCQDMNFQELSDAVRGVQSGLCDGFYAMNTSLLNGFNGVQRDMCTGFANTNAAINQARFENQQCCCETNRNIDNVRFENSRNTCDIVNAIREDGALTRAQMTQTEMQNLRDQLQTANFQLSQQAQNSTLINQLRPCPIPAYLSCSPYTSYDPFRNGYGYGGYGNGCGCGCGCNNGCNC